MKKFFLPLAVALTMTFPVDAMAESFRTEVASESSPLESADVMEHIERVADYFITTNPDVGADSYVGGKKRSSKIWTRGVFYEGLFNAWREKQVQKWLDYSVKWAEFHKWISSDNNAADNADYQCCGQAYLHMYQIDPSQTVRMEHVKMRIDNMIAAGAINHWTWIDAIQMSMPIMAKLGEITADTKYWDYMWRLYQYTRDKQGGSKKGGGSPLFNTGTGLWYRDYQYDPPYKDLTEPDKDCYWSRGNGWVYMALSRIMQFTPADETHRAAYQSDFVSMSRALAACQRADGSWNVSLAAPTNFGQSGSIGPEMTGTSLFIGGMAYGVRTGLLDRDVYMDVILKGWEAMRGAVHSDGFVGYLQGSGAKPEDGGVVTFDSHPDFEDFGIGCWLWGASEVHALAAQLELESGIESPVITEPADDAPYYDILGRVVFSPVPGKLYIRNGKKLIFRQ